MAKNTKAYIALVFVCITWGTTYLAIRIGVRHYPPFLFAGVRQALAGLILIPVALLMNRQNDATAKNVLQQMLVGFLLISVGNGFLTWGEKYIESGVAALICSLMPLFAVLFSLLSSKKDRFNAAIGWGLLLGICGVGLIFRRNIADITNPAYLAGILVVLLATSSWALGSVINKKQIKSVNPMFNAGLQLLSGGIFMLFISPLTDNYKGMELWNAEGLLAFVYLLVFGSVLAYAAYMYMLNELPIGIATIYAYINPLIAVIVGFIFLKEALDVYTGMAFITIAISVYLVNKGYRKQHKTALPSAFPESVPVES